MARRAGSEDGGSKAGRKKSTPDHANVTPESFREAVKLMAEADSKVREANEARKAVRKRIKAMGIELGDMDATVKMADWERPEVRETFERRQKYAEWLGLPIGSQGDLFKGLSDEEIQNREWHATGRTAFLAGKERLIPAEVPEEFEIAWTAGYDGKPVPKLKGEEAPPKATGRGKGKQAAAESNVVNLPKREGPSDDTDPEFEKGGPSGKPH